MKIGILTFNWAVNYGAILQMYALYNYLFDQKYEVFIINYSPEELSNLYSLSIIQKPVNIKKVVRKTLENIYKKKLFNKFNNFINKNFQMTNKIINRTDLKNIVKQFDLIIVGSDQVWNYEITKKYIEDYLLLEIDCKKLAYAASLGKNNIKDEVKDMFQRSLKNFECISLREYDSIPYLKSIYNRNDYVSSVDPVFLLDKKQWIRFATQSDYKISERNYILVYMLEFDEYLLSKAKELSKKNNLPIYSIEIPYIRIKKEFKGIKKLHDVGLNDFVKLFNNAAYILTNSFHGTAFSLILNKKFVSFVHAKANLRIENLLCIYGLKDCQIVNNKIDIEKIFLTCEYIYKNYNERNINSEIEKSKRFLLDSINYICEKS